MRNILILSLLNDNVNIHSSCQSFLWLVWNWHWKHLNETLNVQNCVQTTKQSRYMKNNKLAIDEESVLVTFIFSWWCSFSETPFSFEYTFLYRFFQYVVDLVSVLLTWQCYYEGHGLSCFSFFFRFNNISCSKISCMFQTFSKSSIGRGRIRFGYFNFLSVVSWIFCRSSLLHNFSSMELYCWLYSVKRKSCSFLQFFSLFFPSTQHYHLFAQ